MKKKLAVVLACAMLCMLVVVGCGGGSELSGKYSISGAQAAGQEFSGDQMDTILGLIGIDDMSFTFSGEDKVVMEASVNGQTTSGEGTFTLDGTNLTLTFGGQEMAATYEDGKISIEQSGATLIFSK